MHLGVTASSLLLMIILSKAEGQAAMDYTSCVEAAKDNQTSAAIDLNDCLHMRTEKKARGPDPTVCKSGVLAAEGTEERKEMIIGMLEAGRGSQLVAFVSGGKILEQHQSFWRFRLPQDGENNAGFNVCQYRREVSKFICSKVNTQCDHTNTLTTTSNLLWRECATACHHNPACMAFSLSQETQGECRLCSKNLKKENYIYMGHDIKLAFELFNGTAKIQTDGSIFCNGAE